MKNTMENESDMEMARRSHKGGSDLVASYAPLLKAWKADLIAQPMFADPEEGEPYPFARVLTEPIAFDAYRMIWVGVLCLGLLGIIVFF